MKLYNFATLPIGGLLAAIFLFLMIFYTCVYPIFPFWGDDWLYLADFRSILPINSWNPSRVFHETLSPLLGLISAYITAPIFGIEYLDSITLTIAFACSVAFVVVLACLYACVKWFSQSRFAGIFSVLTFFALCFYLFKPDYMPLIMPVTGNQGVGYTQTVMLAYFIPNMLNLALMLWIVLCQIRRADNEAIRLSPFSLVGGIMVVYFSQFSIISSSAISAIYAGCVLSLEVLKKAQKLRPNVSVKNLVGILKSFGFFECALLSIVFCWIVAALLEIGGGRYAQYTKSPFSLIDSFAYLKELSPNIRLDFFVLFAVVFLFCVGIYLCKRNKNTIDYFMRDFLIVSSASLLLLGVLYWLMFGRDGVRTYWLASGWFYHIFAIFCVLLAYIMPRYSWSKFIGVVALVFVLCRVIFQSPYIERPMANYNYRHPIVASWVAKAQIADKNGVNFIEIYVPREFGHWRWKWFINAFPETLYKHGIVNKKLKITFMPKS